MKIVKTKLDFDEFLKNIKENNLKFQIELTGTKALIMLKDLKFVYYANPMKGKKGLHFIRTVKNYIEDNGVTYYFDRSKISYNVVNLTIKKSVFYSKDVFEIDLKAAFWYLAFKNGFIDYELFKKGLKVDKKIRLIAAGALATRKNIFFYEGENLKNTEVLKSEHTEGIFFKLAFDVDTIMKELIKAIDKKDFYFYWVDAIFFKGENNIKLITDIIKRHGLKFKVVPIKKIIRKEKSFEVMDFDFKERKFNFIERLKFDF